MPIVEINFRVTDKNEGMMIEDAAAYSKWSLAADGRIKTAEDSFGIGPVAYLGRPENQSTGEFQSDGVIRDALLMFWDEDDCVLSWEFDLDPTDLSDTVSAWLASVGADTEAMSAKRP